MIEKLPDRLVPIELAAVVTDRPQQTIRNWAASLAIRSACDVRSRKLVVSLGEVAGRHYRSATRRRQYRAQRSA